MDRVIIYPGQVPLETDLLSTNRNSMLALSKLAAAMLGVATLVNGFATTQTTVPSLGVQVAAGEIYSSQNLDGTAYSSLAADTTHQILKQGISLDPVILGIAAPVVAGQSINYLIEVSYQDQDLGLVVLPYYNASNPGTAYSGPSNSGVSQATLRKGAVVIQAKAGVSATTGTQATPAPDAGFVGVYVVTIAFGAATVINANITPYPSAPFIVNTGQRLVNVQTFSTPGATVYTPTPGTKSIIVEVLGGGGGGTGSPAATGAQVGLGTGGGAGAYAKSRLTSAFSGLTVTVGAAGAAGAAGAVGSGGGQSSFGATVIANGGGNGGALAAAVPIFTLGGGSGAAAPVTGNMVNGGGASGALALATSLPSFASGAGGSSVFGGGAPFVGGSSMSGAAATAPGAGGSGGATAASGVAQVGGAGGPGLVIIHEYS